MNPQAPLANHAEHLSYLYQILIESQALKGHKTEQTMQLQKQTAPNYLGKGNPYRNFQYDMH